MAYLGRKATVNAFTCATPRDTISPVLEAKRERDHLSMKETQRNFVRLAVG